MNIDKRKDEILAERMNELGINESDLVEKFILGAGSGGQKINKSSTCVYLKHLPTGLEVKCQRSRSREENRFFARRLLVEKLEKKLLAKKSVQEQEREKIRRQKRRRSRRQKEKMLKEKREHSEIKTLRGKPF